MSANTNDILNELYALDPDLQQKESEIIQIIDMMIKDRPVVEINEHFRAELRQKILQEISSTHSSTLWSRWWPMMSAMSVCMLFGIWLSFGVLPTPPHTPLSFQQEVETLSPESFGPIHLPDERNLRPQSGGGGGGGLGGTADTVSSKMMAPDAMIYPPIDMPFYTYSYKGDIKMPDENLSVYKKTSMPFDSDDTASIVKNLSLKEIDVTAFDRLGVSNITLAEDTEYGYMMNLDFINGTISMYQNYLKWPQPACDPSGCVQPPKLTEKDIPEDAEIIQASRDFIEKYQIDITHYGAPSVDKTWRIWYARSAEMGQEQIVPDMYTVTYPFTLEGKALYQEGGMYR